MHCRCGKKDNMSSKIKSESNITQIRKEKKTSKDEKKTELTQTLIQRIKAMKASQVKNQQKLYIQEKEKNLLMPRKLI